jgi:hypothetical protein
LREKGSRRSLKKGGSEKISSGDLAKVTFSHGEDVHREAARMSRVFRELSQKIISGLREAKKSDDLRPPLCFKDIP